jgi:hypothetical protein
MIKIIYIIEIEYKMSRIISWLIIKINFDKLQLLLVCPDASPQVELGSMAGNLKLECS